MNRDQKAVAIAEIAEHIDESEAIFAVDYRGITVAQVAELRAKLREADADLQGRQELAHRTRRRPGRRRDAQGATSPGPTALTFVRGDVATRRQGGRRLRRARPSCCRSRAA